MLEIRETKTLEQIEAEIAADPKAVVYYGAVTCWWTHDPKHLGKTNARPGGHSLPCDPRGGVLMMTLEGNAQSFIDSARTKGVERGQYGPHGLRAFAAAHHENSFHVGSDSHWCERMWDLYNAALDRAFGPIPETIAGPFGTAYKDIVGAGSGSWIVTAPGYHPAWPQYLISWCHLRPMEGAKPAHFYSALATHDVQVFAIDPFSSPKQRGDRYSLLTPQNFVGQWASGNDELAERKIATVVHRICHGTLSPDTDFRAIWKAEFPFHPYDG